MGFDGYLIRKPNANVYFPERLIVASSYQVTPNIRQDKDPKRDLNGKLHRAVVKAKPSTIKFSTRELHADELHEIKAFFDSCMESSSERKVKVRFWCPDTEEYKTETMYIPDVAYTIVFHTNDDIIYAPIEYELIGYGY